MIDLDILKIEATADYEEVNDLLYRLGCTDGLPVVPPTAGRVTAMLGSRSPEQVVAVLPPMRGRATLRKLAICAVMAGCRPEHLPVLGAAVEAVAQPEFNLFDIQTTTGTATPLLLINGPVIQHCSFNAGANALGPGIRSNATLGRALRLVLPPLSVFKPAVPRPWRGEPPHITQNPSCAACPDRAVPRHAWLRAAFAGGRSGRGSRWRGEQAAAAGGGRENVSGAFAGVALRKGLYG
jgi:hypothetical protein